MLVSRTFANSVSDQLFCKRSSVRIFFSVNELGPTLAIADPDLPVAGQLSDLGTILSGHGPTSHYLFTFKQSRTDYSRIWNFLFKNTLHIFTCCIIVYKIQKGRNTEIRKKEKKKKKKKEKTERQKDRKDRKIWGAIRDKSLTFILSYVKKKIHVKCLFFMRNFFFMCNIFFFLCIIFLFHCNIFFIFYAWKRKLHIKKILTKKRYI